MDQGVRGWVYNTARKNFWRIAQWYEFDDLVQDGFEFYQRICVRYPNVTEPKHRMRLFQTAFTNHIHDLSKRKSRLTLIPEAELDTPLTAMLDYADPSQDPDLAFVIKQLPPAILTLLRRVTDNRENPTRRRLDGTRETTNQKLCRFAGLDPNQRDILLTVLRYMRGSPTRAV